jgi:succinate dehydrogenase / fumarate reductase cytochrome b subunit
VTERSAGSKSGGTFYKGRGGQWAFVGHRVSGFLVFFFLLLHIVDVATIRWPGVYDEIHRLYGNVLLRSFEVGLLFALLFHTLNGLRIVVVDFFPGQVARERRLLTAVVVITLAAGLPGAFVIMKPFLDGHL